jgi:alkyldihydroxyacetonephosphate synthase
LLFEGDKAECESKHAATLELAKKFHGMSGGAENGIRGYLLTFMVAYTRDLAADYQVAAESFETSCPWANVSQLCSRVKKRIYDEGAKVGFGEDRMWCSFRVT